jgi:Tfp pilus assembly protein PilF
MADKTRMQQIQEMLADDPNDAMLRYMLAMEYVSQSGDEQAVACFRGIFETTPDYVPAYMHCAKALVRLGRDAEARQAFESGIAVAQRVQDFHARDEMQAMLAELD